jgi:hypothetical protein
MDLDAVGELFAVCGADAAMFLLPGEDGTAVSCKGGVLSIGREEFTYPVLVHPMILQGGWKLPEDENRVSQVYEGLKRARPVAAPHPVTRHAA